MESFTGLNITAREERPTLWVFGCSHSFGVGLVNGEGKYGTLLAEELKMPLKLVAFPGSSTHFSLRHLMNANIKEGDIVIWQLTTAERFSYCEEGFVREVILPQSPKQKYMEFYTQEQLYFQQISLLNMGVMYLRAKQVKFAITSIQSGITPDQLLLEQYIKYPEYCPHSFMVDRGSDGIHAGPLSHRKLSQLLFNHIQSYT